MKRKLTLQDYVSAMDAFVADQVPPITCQRQEHGDAVTYVFLHDGIEIGRISALPPAAWAGNAVQVSERATARARGLRQSHELHGDLRHVPDDEQTRDAAFVSLLRRHREHMALWLGQEQYAFVWDHVQGEAEAADDLDPTRQTILSMWKEKYTAAEIGREVSLSPGRVANIVTELRKILGEEAVPFHRKS